MTLRKYRRLRGMTAAVFADLLGISQGSYSRYERGLSFPGPVVLDKIAKATKGAVTYQDLIDNRLGHIA